MRNIQGVFFKRGLISIATAGLLVSGATAATKFYFPSTSHATTNDINATTFYSGLVNVWSTTGSSSTNPTTVGAASDVTLTTEMQYSQVGGGSVSLTIPANVVIYGQEYNRSSSGLGKHVALDSSKLTNMAIYIDVQDANASDGFCTDSAAVLPCSSATPPLKLVLANTADTNISNSYDGQVAYQIVDLNASFGSATKAPLTATDSATGAAIDVTVITGLKGAYSPRIGTYQIDQNVTLLKHNTADAVTLRDFNKTNKSATAGVKISDVAQINTDGSVTFKFGVKSITSGDKTFKLPLKLGPATSTTTGDANITILAGGETNTSTVFKFYNTAAEIKVDAAGPKSLATVATNTTPAFQRLADFNISFRDNTFDKNGSFYLFVSGVSNNGQFDQNQTKLATFSDIKTDISDRNRSIALDVYNSNAAKTVEFVHPSVDVNDTVAGNVSVYLYKKAGSEGNFTALDTTQKVIGTVQDNNTSIDLSSNATYIKKDLNGTYTVDINITELNQNSFQDKNGTSNSYIFIKLLNSNVSFRANAASDKATIHKYDLNSSGQFQKIYTDVNATTTDGNSTFIIKLGDAGSDTTGGFISNPLALEKVNITSLKLAGSSSLAEGEAIQAKVGYCPFYATSTCYDDNSTSINDKFGKIITLGTGTSRNVALELNTTAQTVYYNSANAINTGTFKLKISEINSTAIANGTDITLTLNKGSFDASSLGAATDGNSLSTIGLDALGVPTLTNNNKTLTFKVLTTSTNQGVISYTLPKINVASSDYNTSSILTMDINGTAIIDKNSSNLSGKTITIGNVVDPNPSTTAFDSSNPAKIDINSTLKYTAPALLQELGSPYQIVSGGTLKFKSQDTNFVFTGKAIFANSKLSNLGYEVTCSGAGTNEITCTIPSQVVSASNDDIQLKVEGNLSAAATNYSTLKYDVTDVNAGVKSATNLELVYVGTIYKDLVASELNTSAFPGATKDITFTGITGTLSATSSDGNITTAVSGSTVKITPSSSMVIGKTATVTVTDSVSKKTQAINVTVSDYPTLSLSDSAFTIKYESNATVVANGKAGDLNVTFNGSLANMFSASVSGSTITISTTAKEDTKGSKVTMVVKDTASKQEKNATITIGDATATTPKMTTPVLVSSWNLIGNSATSALSAKQLSDAFGSDLIWAYHNGVWSALNKTDSDSNISSIAPNQGFWVKSSTTGAKSVILESNATASTAHTASTTGAWTLYACNSAKTVTAIKTAKTADIVWAYDSITKNWNGSEEAATKDYNVSVGQGYWVKKAVASSSSSVSSTSSTATSTTSSVSSTTSSSTSSTDSNSSGSSSS